MDEEKLKNKVKHLLYSNIQQGESMLLGKNYSFIAPSPYTYPFQFWWDTFFHVFILCNLDEYDLAKKNIESLFAQQDHDGFIGHMIFWKKILPRNKSDILQAKPTLKYIRPHMSSLIQPTLAAKAVERIYTDTGDKYFLYSMIPKLKKYYDWLEKNRDFDNDGLISIISPIESGIDWKPSYDAVLNFKDGKANWKLYWKVIAGVDGRNFLNRYDVEKIYKNDYFIVKDTLVNVLYSQDLKAFSRLLRTAGIDEYKKYHKRGVEVGKKIIKKMYDKKTGAFFDIYGKNDHQIRVLTFTTFLPLLLEETPNFITKRLIEEHFRNKNEFSTPYPIPSTAANEPSFSTDETTYLWRGPTWVISNWLVFHCLRQKGYIDEAKILKDSVIKLIHKDGFREYYDPYTGKGMGAKNFTWSGLVLDMN